MLGAHIHLYVDVYKKTDWKTEGFLDIFSMGYQTLVK